MNEYESGNASLFHSLAATVTIWAWCPNCWTQTNQTFDHEDDRYEYYKCETCHKLHKIAVR